METIWSGMCIRSTRVDLWGMFRRIAKYVVHQQHRNPFNRQKIGSAGPWAFPSHMCCYTTITHPSQTLAYYGIPSTLQYTIYETIRYHSMVIYHDSNTILCLSGVSKFSKNSDTSWVQIHVLRSTKKLRIFWWPRSSEKCRSELKYPPQDDIFCPNSVTGADLLQLMASLNS